MIAMCPAHPEEPLVSTFHWRGKEFVCLKCGRLYAWLDPVAKNETPKRIERMEARKAEWVEHASDLITVGSRLTSCERCSELHEDHNLHATEEEWAAHKAAQEWLLARTGRAHNTGREPK